LARIVEDAFFDRDPCLVARELLGKVLRRRRRGLWLAAVIVETEAYELAEQGSHASQGRTPSREALWAAPGTIYMYYSRGGDSLNVSCRGDGNAVLVKGAAPWTDATSPPEALETMRALNPVRGSARLRDPERLCAGQTLLCRSLALRVPDWDGRRFDVEQLRLEDVGYRPDAVVQTTRLGIPTGRDEALMYRFVDRARARSATSNPLTRRGWRPGREYRVLESSP
jgi:DNA-3-methyladenine glycosylase